MSHPRRISGTIPAKRTGAKSTRVGEERDQRLIDLRFGAPTASEVLAISLPGNLKSAVQELAGKQGVSALVTRAITNELARLARAELVAWVEAETGPITAAERDEARALLAQ